MKYSNSNVGFFKPADSKSQFNRGTTAGKGTSTKNVERTALFCEELCVPQIIILGSDLFFGHDIELLIMIAATMADSDKFKARIIVSGDVIELIRERRQTELSKNLDKLVEHDFLRFIANGGSGVEYTLASFVKRHSNNKKMLVITHSSVLLLQLEQLRTKVRTVRPCKGGALEIVRASTAEKSVDIKSAVKCQLSDEPAERSGKLLKSGCCVRHEDGTIYKLGDMVGNSSVSGEGRVYIVSDKLCVKIFHKQTSTPYKYEKIRKLSLLAEEITEKRPDLAERIAFPLGLVYNSRSEPVGYLQKRFTDVRELSVLNISNGINLSKIERIKLAISLSELTCFLNEEGIILSDVLSYQNIMFDDKMNAYMVDMDSVQLVYDGVVYLCSKCRNCWMSPEHISDKVYDYVRNPKDDSWALALLLFYIMFTTTPYSRVNCGTLCEDTVAGIYSFPDGAGRCRDDIAGGRDGVFYKIIMNYSPNLVQDMYDTFSSEGRHFKEKDRFDCTRWLKDCVSELIANAD